MAKKPLTSMFVGISMAMMVLLRVKADKPPIFVFGDSTMDVGTNNFLPESKARADIRFYGIDSRNSQPTGRFSNGWNIADQIARLVGYRESPRPYLSLITRQSYFKRNVLTGVNFASGGSGILPQTGKKLYGKVIPLGEQVEQFATVQNNITELMGASQGTTILSNSLFLISTGSNDIFEHFECNKSLSKGFAEYLGSQYEAHLENLTRLGARRFAVIGVPAIGCVPIQRLQGNGVDGCVDELNGFAEAFFFAVEGILQQLQSKYQGVQVSLGNALLMTTSIIQNPLTFGFKDVKEACCGNGTLNAEFQCSPTARVCQNREQHLFWDQFHPTQTAAALSAVTLFAGSPPLVTPVNFSSIAEVYV